VATVFTETSSMGKGGGTVLMKHWQSVSLWYKTIEDTVAFLPLEIDLKDRVHE